MGEFDKNLPDNVKDFRAPKPTDVPLTESSDRLDVSDISPIQLGKVVPFDLAQRKREIDNALRNMRRDRFAGDSIYDEMVRRKEDDEL